jgi:hypothetical protein
MFVMNMNTNTLTQLQFGQLQLSQSVNTQYKKKKINNKPQGKRQDKLKKTVLSLSLMLFSGLTLPVVAASANESIPTSVSYGAKTQQLDQTTRQQVIIQNTTNKVYDQLIGKAQTKSRTKMIAEKQTAPYQIASTANTFEPPLLSANLSASTRYYTPEFSVYDANVFLEDDIDGDGYYQTFGVVFDADVYNPNGNESSVIYAELYLSTNGINWSHYYTTDDFLIVGNNEDDQFEVITTFAQGYNANYYDILIDIYEVGYSNIVATYSANDNNVLYALPLESADNDQPYIEEPYVEEVIIVHGGSHGGGSSSIAFLLFVFVIVLAKAAKNTKYTIK